MATATTTAAHQQTHNHKNKANHAVAETMTNGFVSGSGLYTSWLILISYNNLNFNERSSLHADLVVSVLSDVAHPGKSLVTRLLNYFEVANLNTAHCEVGHFEL